MPISAGQLNRKAAFQRRAPLPVDGQPRGGFTSYGPPVWAAYVERRPRDITVSGLTLTARTATLSVRDCAWARTITRSDRVDVGGDVFDVTANALADRSDGVLRFDLVEAQTVVMYAREMDANGETVTLRRESLDPAPLVSGLRARVTGFKPEELASGIDQGARKVMLLAEDIEREIAEGRWPAPVAGATAILKNDTILLRGAPLSVESVDDNTRRVAGELIAYEIVALG